MRALIDSISDLRIWNRHRHVSLLCPADVVVVSVTTNIKATTIAKLLSRTLNVQTNSTRFLEMNTMDLSNQRGRATSYTGFY